MGRIAILIFPLILCACQPTAYSPSLSEVPATIGWVSTETTPTLNKTEYQPTATRTTSLPTEETPQVMTKEKTESPSFTITILYNNIEYDPSLEAAWGFSALVERNGVKLLFDTGGDGAILTRNMAALDVDPGQIQSVILSHIHGDHTGGLNALLDVGMQPTVYILPSFPVSFKNAVKQRTNLVEVEPGQPIAEGVLTTGEMGTNIPEQALILRTDHGMVILTGCAHPGIVQIVEQAIMLTNDPVYLVMGGFHLGGASTSQIASIVDKFKKLGVEKVAPSHCTGDQAMNMFRDEYGDDFIESGVGFTIVIEP
jgi:7,8-dihydropterin-6-yl-methyl-4-(beta-D-ribofuranosyl)aminobenzene 5'-phosphate synthase